MDGQFLRPPRPHSLRQSQSRIAAGPSRPWQLDNCVPKIAASYVDRWTNFSHPAKPHAEDHEASERPSEDLCPSVRRVRRSEAKNSLWDHRAARATGRPSSRLHTSTPSGAREESELDSDSLGVGSFNLFAQSFSRAVVLFLPIESIKHN